MGPSLKPLSALLGLLKYVQRSMAQSAPHKQAVLRFCCRVLAYKTSLSVFLLQGFCIVYIVLSFHTVGVLSTARPQSGLWYWVETAPPAGLALYFVRVIPTSTVPLSP